MAAFRQLGENAKASLRTGDSVIVTGRLKIRNWESNGKHGTSVDIEADAIGHDLRWGTTAYRPQARAQASATGRQPTPRTRHPAMRVGVPDEEKDSSAIDLSWADPEAELTGRG